MKVLSLFSGIGAFEKALDNLEIPYELVAYCEIDKYASKSYAAIHGVDETKNLGDITKVDEKKLPKDIDLITYGFPCQDISTCGKQKGLFNADGTQTRSGLFFEALRIIEETQPRVAIAENVKNLTSKKFALQFKIVLDSLKAAGYNNYFKVLNAKDYGIPQNRERVFIVSIRKDIDNGNFSFPVGFPLHLRLKDMLEDEVDEKFYVSDKGKAFITNPMRLAKKYTAVDGDISLCLTAKGQSNWTGTFISDSNSAVLVREATKKGYAEAVEGDSINLEQPNSKTRRGRVGHGVAQTLTTSPQQGVVIKEDYVIVGKPQKLFNIYPSGGQAGEVYNSDYCAPCLPGFGGGGGGKELKVLEGVRIRKLTPKECFRLMGFDDSDFEKAEAVNSNTQLYKQAGNSIVVPVVEHIIEALIDCGALN